jgi:hypothetical protein
MNVTVLGSGERATMFAHGFGCDRNMWRNVPSSFRAPSVSFSSIMSVQARPILAHTVRSNMVPSTGVQTPAERGHPADHPAMMLKI